MFLGLGEAKAKTVEYDIDINYETVNFTGKDVEAMTLDGQIPGPTITATEGDVLQVTFNNKMDVHTSIHWHGILLPNDQDGVPYVTTMPIRANASFTYSFPIIQAGTYWYHTHTGLQEQRGLYGALVFHSQQPAYEYDKEVVVVLSDWTNENPKQVLRHLKMDGDYYALKKDSVQSWYKVIKSAAIGGRMVQSFMRMGPMDLSDVGYDAFLLNGKPKSTIGDVKKGDRVLLRIVNASASTYFNIQFASESMQVVSSDGLDVEPFEVERIQIAVAETYDVIVTIPDNNAYEFRATAMDGTGYASGLLGKGTLVKAPDISKPNLLLMGHGHSRHVKKSTRVLDYNQLRSLQKTVLPEENPTREVLLRLTGNMERYIWSFNNKTLKEEEKILIRKGENVRFVLKNETMMNHPIHLHGHFFRVINDQGEYSPLKHTVDVRPMETTIIEFDANLEKDWLFHCHILYHMMSGMTRIVHYEGSKRDPQLVEAKRKDKPYRFSDWYSWGMVSTQSNMVDGFFRLADVRNQFEVEWDNNYTGEYDIEPQYLRNVTRFLDLFVGGEFDRNHDDEVTNHATWGFRYVLPLLIDMEYRVDHRGSMQLEFETELQLTDRLEVSGVYELEFELENHWDYSDVSIEHEYRVELEYRITKNFSLIGNYDSDHRGGGGARLRF